MSLLSLLTGKSRPVREDSAPAPVPPLATVAPGAMRSARPGIAGDPPVPNTATLDIPCPELSDEEACRDEHRQRGQFLARQDRWEDLAAEMSASDSKRAATAAGMPVADLLCFGARADVVMAVEHALIDDRPDGGDALISGIEALEHILAEKPDCPMRAVTVAQAHMDIGWTWRGTISEAQVPQRNREAFEAHFDRARDILSNAASQAGASPLICAALCALHGAGAKDTRLLERDFERLIDLQPGNPGPMRSLGSYMSPRWFGTLETLELEARRTAARLTGYWGAGAYVWVMMDALPGNDAACTSLDLEFFLEGIDDILERRPDQHSVNLLAAWCANTMGRCLTGHSEADAVRSRLSEVSHRVVRQHMTELHPLIWAHAARGFDNNINIGSARRFFAAGKSDAMRLLREVFASEFSEGHSVTFTVDGPVIKRSAGARS